MDFRTDQDWTIYGKATSWHWTDSRIMDESRSYLEVQIQVYPESAQADHGTTKWRLLMHVRTSGDIYRSSAKDNNRMMSCPGTGYLMKDWRVAQDACCLRGVCFLET